MAPRKEWRKFRVWFRGILSSEDENHYVPDGGPQWQGDYIQNIINNGIHVHGDNNTVVRQDGQGDRNIMTQIMSLLSQHVIHGAAHDSSARTPPPRCHPETRVKLIARITAWFEDQASLELLLWITGPAGVGKSAIVQTFAEYLSRLSTLGASVFISRPNKRDNPHGVFITIAYQLATRIEAYRNYIVERLSPDPELLSGDIQAQFMALIFEPFVEKKIGAGGKRWGILLDGLDELQGKDAQCEIIQLISTFVHEHPNVPLVWIISSRPESHISNTFDDDGVQHSCLSEYIPIDSTEACEDVERFLRSSFKMVQKKYRHSVPSDWPSNIEFLQVTTAASGLFVYAEVVMQFIRDPDYADPVSRLEVLLSVIDHSNAVASKENPFIHLDALYSAILSSIPSTLWPTTKHLFGVAIFGGRIGLGWRRDGLRTNLLTLRGMSILFGVTRNVVYASLDKCQSTLKIQDWKVAHKKPLTFLHASFSDYLKDSGRSRDFYIGDEEDVKKDVESRLLEIWSKCSGDDINLASVESTWYQYCLKLADKSPSRAIEKFHANLFHNIIHQLGRVVPNNLGKQIESPASTSLRKIHMRKLCYFFNALDIMLFVTGLMTDVSLQPRHVGLFREVELRELEFGHLDLMEMSPVSTHYEKDSKSFEKSWAYRRPRSNAELKAFVSDLELLQKSSPGLKVVIVGGVPQERVVAFRRPLNGMSPNPMHFMYYVVPYPE
ncbi:hypothetical protein AGABI1DRAFT_108303 [Agaricus bisporus var. burnettii JB137-S8]|uniref:Nephrocystin 3-like N-terminal domain-containing protein n=1 Tax=Agaricus bisporus var. burnettii (strain JB137-S8 / ATCC MYA-4627 / FGSC 10392) TaxID=597362 RepID=K5VRU5_AGABU|nr:uncharacterized protein AGABI1DRAFT_108303 [Agaricus bisporus var. burnettii JB137-S8]EKM77174.1 hypothetical protein AGABI1DRAFT_108303 [Agaricus bisporus var. burnettii JB137-S8]